MPSGSTTPTPAGRLVPSTRVADAPEEGPWTVEISEALIGTVVLVQIAADVARPLLITSVREIEIFERTSLTTPPTLPRRERRVSGTLFCEPDDHVLPAFRGALDHPYDPARIAGRPDRLLPLAYAEHLQPGLAIGQWRPL